MPEGAGHADRLSEAVHAFMPAFLVHINPLLHRTRYRGRSYSELELVVVLGLTVMGPMRPARLSRHLAIEKGSLTSVIRRLDDLGMITRDAAAGDARGYVISLTEAGEALVDHLSRQRRDGFRTLFADLPPDHLDTAAHGLAVLTEYLTNRETELRDHQE